MALSPAMRKKQENELAEKRKAAMKLLGLAPEFQGAMQILYRATPQECLAQINPFLKS